MARHPDIPVCTLNAFSRAVFGSALALALGTFAGACVSGGTDRYDDAHLEPALAAPTDALLREATSKAFSGVGLSLTVERTTPSQPTTLFVAFRSAQGETRAFSFAVPDAQEGASTPAPPATHALVFPLPAGAWTLASTAVGLGKARVSFSLLPVAEGPIVVESKTAGLVHLGELKITLSTTNPPPSTNAHTDVKTTYLPFTAPRTAVWTPFEGLLNGVTLERLAPSQATASFVQVPTPLLVEQGDDGPAAAPSAQGAHVGLLSNEPGYAFFESEPGRITRVRSAPLPGAPGHHVFTFRAREGSFVTFKGGCLPPDPARFLPDCPLATLLPDSSAPRTLEPLSQGAFRYLGWLEVDATTKVFTLRHEWPDGAREPFLAWLGGLVPTTFALGETLRSKPPGAWTFVDARETTLQGLPPGTEALASRVEDALRHCTQELWRADPLAPTEFLLWIEPLPAGKLTINTTRSRGFAGPGVRRLEACLLARSVSFDAPLPASLSQGFGVRFH